MSTNNHEQQIITELSGFFELLAKFDFEDNKKELLATKTSSLDSASSDLVLEFKITKSNYETDRKDP